VVALMCVGMLSLPSPAKAGWGCGWGCGWGPGLVGFGVGALVGTALFAPRVYAGPPPVYGPASYGPPTWSPAWYNYCAQRYRSFDRTRAISSALMAIPISVGSRAKVFFAWLRRKQNVHMWEASDCPHPGSSDALGLH